MPRTVLSLKPAEAPLPPHEQSILNSLVYSKLCDPEIFSILNKVGADSRAEALRTSLEWSINHCLVDDEQG